MRRLFLLLVVLGSLVLASSASAATTADCGWGGPLAAQKHAYAVGEYASGYHYNGGWVTDAYKVACAWDAWSPNHHTYWTIFIAGTYPYLYEYQPARLGAGSY